MNQQREVIYGLRLQALERGEEVKADARRMVSEAASRSVAEFLGDAESPDEYDRKGLQTDLALRYVFSVDALLDAEQTPDFTSIMEAVQTEADAALDRKLEYLVDFGRQINATDVDTQVLSQVLLQVLDEKWKDHLYDLDQLRYAIQYRAYGQRDPLLEYKKDAFDMFDDLIQDINVTFAERFFKVQLSAGPPPPPAQRRQAEAPARQGVDELLPGATPAAAVPAGRAEHPAAAGALGQAAAAGPLGAPAAPVRDRFSGVGRNEPCPCGSGKKFKKCHGAA